MNIAIDGLATLLGQSLADLIAEKNLSNSAIISILHGDIQDLNEKQKDQLDANNTVDIDNQFLNDVDFSQIELVFVADKNQHNQETIANAIAAGSLVIDCAGNLGEQSHIPLVVHDINSHEIQGLTPGFAIATPSAAATMLSQILFPITQYVSGLQRVNVCHFLPAAQLGKVGVEQLASQTAQLLNGMPLAKKQNLEQMAFNLLPQNGAIDDTAYAQTEAQLMQETKRVLNDDTLVMNASCVQVPVFYAQSQVIDLSFADVVDTHMLESALKQGEGIRVRAAKNATPAVVQAQEDRNDVVVSRIRQNPDDKRSLTLWCVSDNMRRGAAGNAVQIADLLIKSYL